MQSQLAPDYSRASRLDITEDDVLAYYQHEGKEFFESLEEIDFLEKQLLAGMNEHFKSTCMAKDYGLDCKLSPEEINHKLGFVQHGSTNGKQVDFAKEYPITSADSNYFRLL